MVFELDADSLGTSHGEVPGQGLGGIIIDAANAQAYFSK